MAAHGGFLRSIATVYLVAKGNYVRTVAVPRRPQGSKAYVPTKGRCNTMFDDKLK